MTFSDNDRTGLRGAYQLGGDWLWFFLAVLAGLGLAAWLGGLVAAAVRIAPGTLG